MIPYLSHPFFPSLHSYLSTRSCPSGTLIPFTTALTLRTVVVLLPPSQGSTDQLLWTLYIVYSRNPRLDDIGIERVTATAYIAGETKQPLRSVGFPKRYYPSLHAKSAVHFAFVLLSAAFSSISLLLHLAADRPLSGT